MMIILDTNILSELMLVSPDPRVLGWLDKQFPDAVWTTSISMAEIHQGIARLADSKRKRELAQAITRVSRAICRAGILPFTAEDAVVFGNIRAERFNVGRPVEIADAMIAAIALRHSMTLATRNVRDFDGLGLDIVDPFNSSA